MSSGRGRYAATADRAERVSPVQPQLVNVLYLHGGALWDWCAGSEDTVGLRQEYESGPQHRRDDDAAARGFGASCRNRTGDLIFTRDSLYRLS